ncbi:low temperature requirement protein A [Floridanema aerugineum]|jgi:low temperature requirement protein LtrA|uniref:Low temperature requirement protein A n=1 Tax=Floridaenema aerugineum BLCC-F46 TaxID=3153654 RepID=A0ABV4WYA7_9CYAN
MSKSLWQRPHLLSEKQDKEKRASWLELFYDLIFVAAIAEVAHYLHGHLTISGFFSYILMFVPIWWSWVGATFYATRFDTENIPHRVLTLIQMVAIAIAGWQLSPVMLMVLLGIACTIQIVLDLIKGTLQPQPESAQ